MEPAKPRKWTEEETKLLIELAQRKERVPAMARELGRHIASVRRRARELGLLLPQGRRERAALAFFRAVIELNWRHHVCNDPSPRQFNILDWRNDLCLSDAGHT